jgi:hypothetical protein
LKYPFVVDLLHKKKRENADLSEDSKSTVIERIKQLHRERMDEPIEKWQIGHLDPTIEDSSPMNLAWQPPIQSKYRDRFKWDRDFIKMWPTANELIPKFGQYYTESERREIYAHLKGVFEPHLCVD